MTETFMVEGNFALAIMWGIRVLSALLIMVAGWMIGNSLKKRICNVQRFDRTLANFLGGFIKYLVLAIAGVTVLGQFGVQTASLIAILGAAGLAVGLALQGTLGNVAAGTMLLILRPFKIGDYIQAGGIGGTVVELGLFGTELATPDNVYIFVPNGKIWNADIWNYSRNDIRRQDIPAGISYHDNIDKAFKVIHDILAKDDRVLKDVEGKEPQVMVEAMSDFSIDLKIRFWTRREDFWATKWDVNKAIKEGFDKNGITIPFPTRTVEMVDPDKGRKDSKKKAA